MPFKLVPPRKDKSPFWSVRGTHLGVYLDRSTKVAEKGTAWALLKQWRDAVERGALTRPGELTFLDAIVAYIKAGGDDRFLGAYDDETATWSGIAGKLGGLPLSAVDQAAIDEAAIALYPAGTPGTRNRNLYTPISAVLKHAGIEKQIKRPKGWRGQRRTDWMTTDQAFRLIAAARNIDAELGIFLTVLLYTGLRLSEALGLTCDKVALVESYAYVPATKNGDPRATFLPPAAVAALAGLARGTDRGGAPVFRFRKNGRLYALLRLAKIAAGDELSFVTFHTFRHTWATWMRRYGGLDTTGLVATGAWRDRTSAARYEHAVVSEEARKALLLPVENPGTRGTDRRNRA